MFSEVSKFSKGYSQESVEQFFELARASYEGQALEPITQREIHTAVFELSRGGYEISEVDAALERLEKAFINKEREQSIAVNGEESWYGKLAEDAQTLYARIDRPVGLRFNQPARGKLGYSKHEVDALCENLASYFERKITLTSSDVRQVRFTTKTGRKAYREAEVDAFIAKVLEVLLGVE